MKKEWSMAIACFEDNIKALPRPEETGKAADVLAWNLYEGLSLLAQALHDDIAEISSRIEKLEGGSG